MDSTKLNITFNGVNRAAINPVLKSAEIIIPYCQTQESKQGNASSISYECSMHPQSVVSFAGMLQDLVNKAGGSVVIANGEGETVTLNKGKADFHFGELEKLLQPVL